MPMPCKAFIVSTCGALPCGGAGAGLPRPPPSPFIASIWPPVMPLRPATCPYCCPSCCCGARNALCSYGPLIQCPYAQVVGASPLVSVGYKMSSTCSWLLRLPLGKRPWPGCAIGMPPMPGCLCHSKQGFSLIACKTCGALAAGNESRWLMQSISWHHTSSLGPGPACRSCSADHNLLRHKLHVSRLRTEVQAAHIGSMTKA